MKLRGIGKKKLLQNDERFLTISEKVYVISLYHVS